MVSRNIEKVVPATVNGGPMSRLIGTVDIDNKGTEHPLPQVDPFMLLDTGVLEKDAMPPFGAHPHRGHSVVTILLQGKVKSWDSFSNQESIITGPASYWVDAGSGVFHDETSVINDESDPSQHAVILQLWVSVKEEDRNKPAALQYDTKLPCVDATGTNKMTNQQNEVVGKIQYYVGGGATIETMHPITVAHITQKRNTVLRIPVDPSHGGFIVNLTGSKWLSSKSQKTTRVTIAGSEVEMKLNDVLVLGDQSSSGDTDGGFIEIDTGCSGGSEEDASLPVDYVICTGEKINESWYKKLVADGAIFASTPDEARAIAKNVEGYAKAGKVACGSFAPFGTSSEE